MTARFITYRPNINRAEPDKLDRRDDFRSWQQEGRIEGWSARKNFELGDLAIFYFATPLNAIAAFGLVDSEPYYQEINDPADFKNRVFCDFRPVWFLETLVPIKEVIAHQHFQKWWKTTPYRGIRAIDPSVARALLAESLAANQELEEELVVLGWSPSAPLDFSMVSPTQKALLDQQKREWTLEKLLDLTWEQFELLVSEVFKRKDTRATVELTPKSKDYGADIIIISGWLSKREIVQCKRYRPKTKVSTPDIHRFAGAMKQAKVKKGYFVTTSTFSRYAAKAAKETNVKMLDGKGLLKIIGRIENFPSPIEFVRQYPATKGKA
jgi:HJR/Mrr/RecB family endonuclease